MFNQVPWGVPKSSKHTDDGGRVGSRSNVVHHVGSRGVNKNNEQRSGDDVGPRQFPVVPELHVQHELDIFDEAVEACKSTIVSKFGCGESGR